MQREFPSSPLAGVGAVIVHHGRVLLVCRGREPNKGRWSIPGGLLELGESLTAGVAREALEETGLEVEPLELVELVDRIYCEGERVRYHYVIADYLCRVVGGTLCAASDAAAVRWVERAEWNSQAGLATEPVNPDQRKLDPIDLGPLALDPLTIRVIELGWQKAQALEIFQQENA